MARDSIRNKHGDLTVHALRDLHLREERSWITVDMTHHILTLSEAGGRYLVWHQWKGPTVELTYEGAEPGDWVSEWSLTTKWVGQIDQARDLFKQWIKEARALS